ncbi:MAG: ABC transporter substrate-binding protein [Rhizobiales bacterium]|nr:ABC transporter substrate-binding protein [Hyphomicrobiales bacterium]MBN9009777.1 ABC transporter substrate-binding protein [Hyphomicrobiales bacterium]
MQKLLAALLLALLAAPAVAEPITIVDAAGRSVAIADTSRIVAIGGTVTEILYALGVEDRIVGVDQTSNYPEAAAAKPNVGYMRQLSPEGVLSLRPSLVVAIEDSGPKDTIDVLERASVPFILVPKAHDAAGVVKTIRFVAEAVGEKNKGEALAAAVGEDLATVEKMRDRITEKRKAVFILGMNGTSLMVAGSHTGAADIFALAGVDNALAAMEGYKPAGDEATLAAAPQALVMMSERTGGITDDAVFAAPALAATPAAKDRRLIRMSGTYLLNFGPRTAHAARDLAAAVYPDLKLPVLPARPWTGHDDGAAH